MALRFLRECGEEDGVTIEAVPLYRFLLVLKQGKYGAA